MDWGSSIISIAKTGSKKISALIRSMKFFSSEVALYFYKSTYLYKSPVYGILLSRLGWCRTVGPLFAASFEPLADYFGRCFSEVAQLIPFPFSLGRSTRYSDRLHDFFVTIPRCYKDVYVNSFFPRTARLCNSLPMECFPLTYNLSYFKSRINRHLLTVGSF